MSVPTVRVANSNGPLPIGSAAKTSGSLKKVCGIGAKAQYPRIDSRIATGSASVMVNDRSSVTDRPVKGTGWSGQVTLPAADALPAVCS